MIIKKPSYLELEKRTQELENESLKKQQTEAELLEKQTLLRDQNINLVRKSIALSDIMRELEDKNYDLELSRSELEITLTALRESEERYRLSLEASPDPVVVYDNEGKASYVNPAFEETFGWLSEEVIGGRIDFVSQENRPETKAAIERMLQGEKIRSFETRLLTKDGRLLDIQISSSLFMGREGKPAGSIVILRDITKHKRIELILKQAKETAEAASQAKSEFLANMSHELRTPLNHIIGFTELVVDRKFGDLNETQEEYLNDALQSGGHLLSLINEILDFSKVEAGKLEMQLSDVNLKMLLENSLIVFKEKAMQHGMQLSTDIDGIPETVKADERKLKQIIYNLLSNAVKFTPENGSITLDAKMQTEYSALEHGKPAEQTNIQNPIPGIDRNFIEISVKDTGIGLKPEELQRIFNPFEQVDSSIIKRYQGTGLGLSMTKRLVELHGGRIWAESEGERKGSRFSFIIPV